MIPIKTTELIQLIENVLELESGSLNERSEAEQVDAWDSLGHLSILVALDSRCDGKVASISEMATAYSVQSIIQLLVANSLLRD
ncbi:hypothetical protein OAJ10_04375 [Paracoccaceae bacterium]|nr:hypothetical protein [Paracoccaceae bacterium]